ncbi:MAG TPA: phosphate ABC transporter permease subunit PstC [Candidatus Dormibacteraeota bacterium]|nr:phosphate ABC transporter permease subunit PstC [Candidatus Dormibacteraeota bacterium]
MESKRALQADVILRWSLRFIALSVLAVIGYFFVRLAITAEPAFSRFGIIGFIFTSNWDVAHNIFGAWPLVAGTLITSVVALVLGVPVAIAAALYVTEFAPTRLRATLALLLDLLAAIPSVVYGLWGVFILIPDLKPAEQWFSNTFSFLPFVGGPVSGPNYFIAGLILAIMIIPIVSAVSREVLATVPLQEKEGALALGATRWEMIRLAVLPRSRAGITSAAMLGLGRAIGETIAVTLVIGSSPIIGHQIFNQGYTLAAVIANEFGEASPGSLHISALIAAGLLLLVLTLIVNGIARGIVIRTDRRHASVTDQVVA